MKYLKYFENSYYDQHNKEIQLILNGHPISFPSEADAQAFLSTTEFTVEQGNLLRVKLKKLCEVIGLDVTIQEKSDGGKIGHTLIQFNLNLNGTFNSILGYLVQNTIKDNKEKFKSSSPEFAPIYFINKIGEPEKVLSIMITSKIDILKKPINTIPVNTIADSTNQKAVIIITTSNAVSAYQSIITHLIDLIDNCKDSYHSAIMSSDMVFPNLKYLIINYFKDNRNMGMGKNFPKLTDKVIIPFYKEICKLKQPHKIKDKNPNLFELLSKIPDNNTELGANMGELGFS